MLTQIKMEQSIPNIKFIPFLIASIIIAGAYGSSFFLPEHLALYGFDSVMAGSIISIGIVTTIICCFLAGFIATRFGVIKTLMAAAFSMAVAMFCFALIMIDVRAAYLGGLMLGVGWSIFFILAPLEIIHYVEPDSRLTYLTILSGTQMAGLGLSAPLGRMLTHHGASSSSVYILFGLLSIVATACLGFIDHLTSSSIEHRKARMEITLSDMVILLKKKTIFPILMIIFAACIFSGLSTYQTIYANSKFFPPDIFFIVFTIISVLLRFSIARVIGRMNIRMLALLLFLITTFSLLLFVINSGSVTIYIFSTVLFATGYGLSYSTLNGMAVNLAEVEGVSMSITSQVFTLGYFFGLFGFPYIGGALIRFFSIDAMFIFLLLVALANIGLLRLMHTQKISHKYFNF